MIGMGRMVAKDSGLSCNLHDFAWHKAKNNPFWHRQITTLKRKIYLIILLLSLLAISGVIFFHPLFKIKKIEVNDVQRIKKNKLEDTVKASILYQKLFILPADNYFLVDLDEIRDIVKNKFSVESIIVRKKFPDSLVILLEEKKTSIIYDNGSQYFYLDKNGKVIEFLKNIGDNEWKVTKKLTNPSSVSSTMVSSTSFITNTINAINKEERSHFPAVQSLIKEFGNYPIVYDLRHKQVNLDDQALSKDMIKGIVDWFDYLSKNSNVPFNYITLEDERGFAIIQTGERWSLKVRLTDVDSQFSQLWYLLKEKNIHSNLNYIDLRFKDRIYWQ